MESKASLESSQGFSVVLAKLNEDILGEKVINSDGSKEWRKAEMSHWGWLGDEGWKRSTASDLADKRGRVGGIPWVSVALGEAYRVCGGSSDFGVLLVLMGLFLSLLSLSLLFSGKKTHTSLLVTASHLVLELLPSAPGDQVPSAFFSSVLHLLQPWEHLLTRVVAACVTGREGTCRGKAFCSRERANISGWGEARQESSGRGLWRLNLEG